MSNDIKYWASTEYAKFNCENCNRQFHGDEKDAYYQMDIAFCSLLCLTQKRFKATPAIIDWLVAEQWSSNSYRGDME